ncbi:MAG: carbohydrate ABC transporter permease [Spirochaetes bacterium]|nr:MAG: carbohydrate ABC transporter permease [Spirochaetota bacterium]
MRHRDIMMTSRTRNRLLTLIFTILVCLVFLSPFVYLISTALKSVEQLLTMPRVLFPLPLHPENFLRVVQQFPILRYFKNTFLVVIGSVAGNLLVSTMAGYALSRLTFKGREILFTITLACMFMPLFLIIIPRFLIFQKLGVIGTLWPLILPTAFGSPFCIFLIRQYLRSIPMELSEAAKVDGCRELAIYSRIIMPLAKPVMATVVIFTTQWRWNDFIEPLIYLPSGKLYTITMGLYTVLGTSAEEINIHLVMAFLIIAILPILLIFLVAQRQFVEGTASTGLKG